MWDRPQKKVPMALAILAVVAALLTMGGPANASPAPARAAGADRCADVPVQAARGEVSLCSTSSTGSSYVPATGTSSTGSGGIELEWIVLATLVAAAAGGVTAVLQAHRSHGHAVA